MKKFKQLSVAVLSLVLVVSLVACGAKPLAPKDALKASMKLAADYKSLTQSADISLSVNVPEDVLTEMDDPMVAMYVEALKDVKASMVAKSDLTNNKISVNAKGSLMGTSLDADMFMSKDFLAVKIPMFPKWIKMTDEDLKESGQEMTLAKIFEEAKKNQAISVKLSSAIIDAIDDKSITDTKDVKFQAATPTKDDANKKSEVKIREIAVGFTTESLYDFGIKVADILLNDKEFIDLMKKQMEEAQALAPDAVEQTPDEIIEEITTQFKEIKDKREDNLAEIKKYVNLDGTKIVYGLNKDNKMVKVDFLFNIEVDASDIIGIEKAKIGAKFTVNTQNYAENATVIEDLKLDDKNSMSIEEMQGM